jgi:tRNA-2-methylthio-N6-dimethylallyladenosine synthase
MNVHESEKIAGGLANLGFQPVDSREDADIIVFNTCCIRDSAEKKIHGHIGELKNYKKNNSDLIVAIVGCMTQQSGATESLKEKYPFIDIILGTANVHLIADKISEIINAQSSKRLKIYENVSPTLALHETQPPLRNSYPNAWINIMYGCDNHCTYCIVPYVRGGERSRDPDSILNEASALLADGYKEITLLGQNVNSYSHSGWNFARLLSTIAELPYKFRLRFMTSHPKDFSSEIIDVIFAKHNICKCIHLPVQAGSNSILKAMNRRYTRESYFDTIQKIRSRLVSCAITTDIMVGFPGETDDDFNDTLDLVQRVRFSNAFTFVYSPRKGTPAAQMVQLPASLKRERIMKLIEVQNQIVKEISDSYLGNTYEVLVDGVSGEILTGKTETGRVVNFIGAKELLGEFVNVHIDKCKASALGGHIDC